MIKKIVLCASIILSANICFAQQNNMSEAEQNAMMQQQMLAMTPMFGQMMEAMTSATFNVLANPETAEKLATFTKNYYDALVAKGFTKEEAMQIAMAVGMPSMPAMGN